MVLYHHDTIDLLDTLRVFSFIKPLWLRALGSTAISQVVDTTVVNVAALSGLLSWSAIAEVTGWNYFYKMTVAALLTPPCYVAHHWIIARFNIQPMSAKHQPIGDLPFAGP